MQWVTPDHVTVNHYWQIFRGVTVATVQEELVNFGRGGKMVEIGVISLGTTTSDGNKREVIEKNLAIR